MRIASAAFKPSLQIEQRYLVRSSGFDIHREILDAVIPNHFCFGDLLQSRTCRFQHATRVNSAGLRADR